MEVIRYVTPCALADRIHCLGGTRCLSYLQSNSPNRAQAATYTTNTKDKHPVGLEPAIPAIVQPQTHALERTSIYFGLILLLLFYYYLTTVNCAIYVAQKNHISTLKTEVTGSTKTFAPIYISAKYPVPIFRVYYSTLRSHRCKYLTSHTTDKF